MLEYLMEGGMFAHNKVSPLVDLLKAIERHDLVTDLVDNFLKGHYREPTHNSLPVRGKAEQFAVAEKSNTIPGHRTPVPTSLAVQESTGINDKDQLQAIEIISPSSIQNLKTLPAVRSTASFGTGGAEHQHHSLSDLHGESNEKLFSHETKTQSSSQPAESTQGLIGITPTNEANTYPRSNPHSIHTTRLGSLPPLINTGAVNAGTPVSSPFGSAKAASMYPIPQTHSEASGQRIAGVEVGGFIRQSSSFELANPKERAVELQSPQTPTSKPVEQPALFCERLGSRRRLTQRFGRSRERVSSFVHWSVQRHKLNEAIYRPLKDKMFKCPKKLELDSGGKHHPKLTLYLHPYGFEEDANKNLTLMIEIDISIKSHIPSSATIRVEVEASDPLSGATLKQETIDCQVDRRVARGKSFLSHKELKDLECERIKFTASAKLYNRI